jgi:hypothetical protein
MAHMSAYVLLKGALAAVLGIAITQQVVSCFSCFWLQQSAGSGTLRVAHVNHLMNGEQQQSNFRLAGELVCCLIRLMALIPQCLT